MQSADDPDIDFKSPCDGRESARYAEFRGFYDVTGNFDFEFHAFGLSHQDLFFHFLCHFESSFR